jgi:hypothetical protein
MGDLRLRADLMSSASGFAGLLMNVPRVLLAYQTTAVDTSDASTYTFTTQAIGTASATRFVIAGFIGAGGTIGNYSSCNIGGSAATQLGVNNGVTQCKVAFYGRTVTSGTTATIDVTFAAAGVRCALVVYALDFLLSTTPVTTATASAANPLVSTLSSVTQGGAAISIAGGNYADAGPITWTGVTRDVTGTVEGIPYSSASGMFFNAQTNLACSATLPTTPSNHTALAISMR